MAGRHTARVGGLRRIGDVIVEYPLPTGAVLTAALVAALAVTPLGAADLMPAHTPSRIPAADAAPVVSLSVPNVVGLSETRAADVLRARGFSMEFRTESWEPATGRTDEVVIRQTPGANAWVAKGTRIALTVAPAGSTVSTPPQNASGPASPGTVSAPAGSGASATTGSAGGAGSSGGSGVAGSGGAAPAPTPQPPAVPQPVAPQPVAPPPVVQVPTPPVPSLPLPTLPGSPLGVVGGLLRGVI
ncbi:PASTA domain-containing protein [Leifsonia shinshuensis]|uniref:PASTA domain-containing protein n=1 Tax=Leifsonia shinshuensis TaxID=150026 RepID=A0A7G6YEF5_9MICO|nr:PASTA domain-containing protein [Leifsonia shinshuensis]QNE36870.1 PASTA domain-containing protein [Leifsonia shinshuensis]